MEDALEFLLVKAASRHLPPRISPDLHSFGVITFRNRWTPPKQNNSFGSCCSKGNPFHKKKQKIIRPRNLPRCLAAKIKGLAQWPMDLNYIVASLRHTISRGSQFPFVPRYGRHHRITGQPLEGVFSQAGPLDLKNRTPRWLLHGLPDLLASRGGHQGGAFVAARLWQRRHPRLLRVKQSARGWCLEASHTSLSGSFPFACSYKKGSAKKTHTHMIWLTGRYVMHASLCFSRLSTTCSRKKHPKDRSPKKGNQPVIFKLDKANRSEPPVQP